jgi:fatty-acyl-CoA synthase
VGSSVTHLDPAAVRARIQEIAAAFLAELGSPEAAVILAQRGEAAHLERGLGLGSLERVELVWRVGTAFSVRLPDRALREAETLGDLAAFVLRQEPESSAFAEPSPAARIVSASGGGPSSGGPDMAGAATLAEVLRLRAQHSPDRVHIHLYEEDQADPRPITFGELYARASSLASELRRRGLGAGRTVALMLPTSAEFFHAFFGVILAGGIPVPIYPPFRADKIEEYSLRQSAILQNAETQFLLTFRRAEKIAKLIQPQVPSLQGVFEAGSLLTDRVSGGTLDLQLPCRGDDTAFLQYTSGSTGQPKGVVLTHANLLANIRAIGEAIQMRPEDVAVSWLPLYHDMGLIGTWLVPLYFGFPVVVLSPVSFLSRPERWLRAIHRHRGTLSAAPNFAYELCVRKIPDSELEGLDLNSWRAALNGAEPVRPETLERFISRFVPFGFHADALMPVYGLAEATLGVAAPPLGSTPLIDRVKRAAFEGKGVAIPATPGEVHILQFVSEGRALPGVELQVRSAEGAPCSERQEGRLWFRSAGATSGYYRNPEASRELRDANGWLDSGDLAYITGGNLYLTGRAKDIIIKAGRNLIPHEIEEIAGRVPGVRTGCVVAFGIPDERTGTERLVVAAEIRQGAKPEKIRQEIVRQVSDALGLPPDDVALLSPGSIPKTSSGKLRRADTQRLFQDGRLGRKHLPVWIQLGRIAIRGLPQAASRAGAYAIRKLLRAIYGVYALAATGPCILAAYWGSVIAPNRAAAAQAIRFFCRLIPRVCFIPVRIQGQEVLAEFPTSKPWIFAPNHSSYLDIALLLGWLPAGSRFVAKGDVKSMPLVKTIVRRAGHFAFDRSDTDARLTQSDEVIHALRSGDSVVIYPEGTFGPASGIRSLQLGAFRAAADTGRPICPVSIRGAREILRDKTFLPRPGRVTITFGPLLRAESSEWSQVLALRDAVREVLAKNTGDPKL